MFALDTNTVIYFFMGMGEVSEHLLRTPPAKTFLPSIVLYELETSIAKSSAPIKRREQLDELVRHLTVLPFGAEEAQVGARIRVNLEKAGTPIGPLDCLIAATALRHGATLVTRNLREFSRVENLSVVNWF